MQYNLDNRAFEGAGQPPTIADVCAVLTGGQASVDDLTRYAALNAFLLNATDQPCTDVSYDKMISEMRNVSLDGPAGGGGRQWVYQTCVEFGFYQTSDAPSAKQPFGTMFPLSFSLQQCEDIYGISGPNVNWTNSMYGGQKIKGMNIVFTNGDIDPWHALSVLPGMEPSVSVEAILVHGTAHW